MKVKDKMTPNPCTVSPDTNIAEAFRLMKEGKIRRLPVVDKSKLVGMVALSDLQQASPSPATTLSMFELNYLLAKTKIKDIIPKHQEVVTVNQDVYIELAAKSLRENKIGGLPVVDDKGKLVGIITETDIFDAFLDLLGVNRAGVRLNLRVDDKPGMLKSVTDLLYKFGVNIDNIVKEETGSDGKCTLILRVNTTDHKPIVEELKKAGFEIESVIIKQ
jgi:acetoin utilization protein AcuB